MDAYTRIARERGVEIRYEARVIELMTDGHAATGVKVNHNGQIEELNEKSVIITAGGSKASPEIRTRYHGADWEMARVRGSRFNTDEDIKMTIDIGASTYGNWSGCHAVGWDYNAPEFGDLDVGDGFQKHSYSWGIRVNATGRRFVDEGADFRNYTYAKYGLVILDQPDQFAWRILDSMVTHILRDGYRIKRVTKVTAPTIETLDHKLEGVDPQGFLNEIKACHAAVDTDTQFGPNIKDGCATNGFSAPKSNWANKIDEGPFEAYQVGCGITFTFGGLRIDPETAQVLDNDHSQFPGSLLQANWSAACSSATTLVAPGLSTGLSLDGWRAPRGAPVKLAMYLRKSGVP